MRYEAALLALLVAVTVGSTPVGAQGAEGAKLSKKEPSLHAEAKVSEEAARASALAAVPNSTVKEGELEKEKGKLIWSFDLKVAAKTSKPAIKAP